MALKKTYIGDVVTPEGRISFPHLEKPDTEGQYADDKYKCTLLIPKDVNIDDLKKAVLKCAKEAWPKRNLKLKDLQHPFRDGDKKVQEAEEAGKKPLQGYDGCLFITCKSKNKPTIVNRRKDDIDAGEVYGGCHARLVVGAWAYEQGGKPGVTFMLDIVQKTKEGQRFGGGGNTGVLPDLDDDDDLDDDEGLDDFEEGDGPEDDDDDDMFG